MPRTRVTVRTMHCLQQISRCWTPAVVIALAFCAAVGPMLAAEPGSKLATPAAVGDVAAGPKGIADLKALESGSRRRSPRSRPAWCRRRRERRGRQQRRIRAHRGPRRASVPGATVDGRLSRRPPGQGRHPGQRSRASMPAWSKITDRGPWPCAEMGSSGDLKPGQWCLTLGYPVTFEHGKPPVVRIGRVLRNRKTEIITDGTIMGGDSGAPLFNLDGKVIGIGTKCDERSRSSITSTCRSTASATSWDRLAKGKDFDSLGPQAGAAGRSVAAEDADEARIGSIVPGSGAEKAGLKPGDVLLKFDGRRTPQVRRTAPAWSNSASPATKWRSSSAAARKPSSSR